MCPPFSPPRPLLLLQNAANRKSVILGAAVLVGARTDIVYRPIVCVELAALLATPPIAMCAYIAETAAAAGEAVTAWHRRKGVIIRTAYAAVLAYAPAAL